MIKYLVGKFLV